MSNDITDHTRNGVAESRERRRRINQAFRDGDLELCLQEIKTELDASTGESTILAALPKVQQRYISEIIEPCIHSGDLKNVSEKLDFLISVGPISDTVNAVVEGIRGRLKSLEKKTEPEPVTDAAEPDPEPVAVITKSEPELDGGLDKVKSGEQKPPLDDEEPEEGWFDAHGILRDAEKAWADGKKGRASEFLKRLDTFSIKDHDYNLRIDGLKRLLEESVSDKSSAGTRQSSAGKWVVLLFIILAIAMAAVLLMDHFRAPEPLSEVETAVPETLRAEPVLGWLDVTGADSAAVVMDSDGGVIGLARQVLSVPPGAYEFMIHSTGFMDTVIKVTIIRAETLRIAVSPLRTPPSRGWLNLYSNPTGARVSMPDGSPGVTPIDSLEVDPGRHTVRFTKTGRVPTIVEIAVSPNQVAVVNADLPQWNDVGRFQLNANPWAFVFVNGDSLGPTPLTTGDLPTARAHELIFRSPDGRIQTKRLSLDPARSSPTPVTIQFAEPGVLAVATTDSISGAPVWANLWIGSQKLGETPGEFRLNPGDLILRLDKPGYASKDVPVSIPAGERLSLTIALVPHSS